MQGIDQRGSYEMTINAENAEVGKWHTNSIGTVKQEVVEDE